jgi:hypothetical protein
LKNALEAVFKWMWRRMFCAGTQHAPPDARYESRISAATNPRH